MVYGRCDAQTYERSAPGRMMTQWPELHRIVSPPPPTSAYFNVTYAQGLCLPRPIAVVHFQLTHRPKCVPYDHPPCRTCVQQSHRRAPSHRGRDKQQHPVSSARIATNPSNRPVAIDLRSNLRSSPMRMPRPKAKRITTSSPTRSPQDLHPTVASQSTRQPSSTNSYNYNRGHIPTFIRQRTASKHRL
jgi:hypothetical protein